jgi:raffinose/stachyose/melibiose transport system substrate-binding protein
MRSSKRRRVGLIATLLVVAGIAAAVGGTASSRASTHASQTLEVWEGGTLAFATPGSGPLKWQNQQIAIFERSHPGWKVHITLLPINMDQLIAKIQAATTAHALPDVLDLFSGTYTTPFAPALMPLNKYVTPAFYKSLSNWDLSCADLDCKGGKGTILAIPMNYFTYALYYNKALFRKAGIAKPPATYAQLYTACKKLKAAGTTPFVYGDRDGYTTVNLLDVNLASYFSRADMAKMIAGKIAYDDPRMVSALSAITKLRELGCVSADATTHEQTDATGAFTSGKGAMVEMYTALVPTFEKGLGSKLGVAPLPQSGPHVGRVAGDSSDNWAISKQASDPDVAWAFVKQMSSKAAGISENTLVGQPSANRAAAAAIKDPYVKWVATEAAHPEIANLDVVIPNKIALTLYKHLQLAFSGRETPAGAMGAVQQAAKAAGHAP